MPELNRPNAETLLKNIRQEQTTRTGKLKIFFGYAAGVGKTYAMLEAAHRAKDSSVDNMERDSYLPLFQSGNTVKEVLNLTLRGTS